MYEGYQLIENFYQRVRNLVNAEENIITQEVLDGDYAPMAETSAKEKVENWQDLEGELLETFKRVVVVETAIRCYSVVELNAYKATQTSSLKVEYRDTTQNILSSLNDMLDELLEQLLPEEDVDYIKFDITQ